MKYAIYFLSIILFFGTSCCKKQAMAKENAPEKSEVKEEKLSEEEKQAQLIENMKNEELPNEGFDYYKIAEQEIPENALARIQRTPCFGRCPIYTMIIYNDGRVEYYGKKFVTKMGRHFAKASEEQLEQLTAKAKSLGFFEFENVYDNNNVTDLPSTIITIKGEEGFKTVVGRYDVPESFNTLGKYIEESFENLEYATPD